MSNIQYHTGADGIVTLTIDMPGQSANTMNTAFRTDYAAAIDKLEAERERIHGVIITSGKKTFFAGGDLHSLLAVQPEDTTALFQRAQEMKSHLRRLEQLGLPVVAAINGSALGGGFELCLACHARFALDSPGIQLGLPEVGLGLLPGGGGIVRMVRMLGLEAAMPHLLEGTLFTPGKAQALGLVTDVAPDTQVLMQQARAWILAHPQAAQPWDRKPWRLPGATALAPATLEFLRMAPVQMLKKTRGCYPAPQAILSAAVEGAVVDFETASTIESRYFARLATGPVAKNLISTFFFQMNEIKDDKGRPAGFPTTRFQRVGVVGAGMMGAGIAHVNALRGITTVLHDVSLEQASKGKAYSEKLLGKRIAKGTLTAARQQEVLDAIVPTAETADLAGCELIIEAVFENRDLKARVTAQAEPHLTEAGIFASNTSTLPITGLAQASRHADRFIGLHFFSPVDRMPLVEVIKGRQTSPQTLARALDYVKQIGKTPIVVNDARGFFTSRVFGTFTREGAAMLGEGVPPALIENAALSVGMPIGPLAVMDETSMALSLSVRRQTQADLAAQGQTMAEHPGWAVIERMADGLGRPGRAGGGGFYAYPEAGPKHLWEGLAGEFGHKEIALPFADLRDRILYIQSIEAIRTMEEGVIESARDANIGSILGIGFPRWTGGTLQFVNMTGLPAFVQRAGELAQRYGERFSPPTLLLEMAQRGERFS